MPQQVPPPHLRPTARPVSHVPLPRYAQPATPAPSGTPVPSGTPALSGTLAPLQGSGTSSPRPIVKLLGTPGYYTRKSRPPAPSPVPSELRLRSQVKLEPAETLVPAQAPAQAQAKAQPAAPVQAPAEAQPEAPAHSPTKPGIVVKLMSLNSTIMAAQREWEQGNRNGTPSSGSSSDSGASTASDIPNIRPARDDTGNVSMGLGWDMNTTMATVLNPGRKRKWQSIGAGLEL
ncbi:hypothetical protein ISF_01125 [Cordyceps fumosorosea ARSEF 2679]|uniref:Uncharacterized protein n=1 Tax=Cordyceps fumosorosea (strain ARSEF 2679) TaxID=1081104 RepID=A0A162LQR5_CORFA|nr:hypothetical protein ISF_01125 [Cordyceps fumosorosea ARSEF 2679]OAA74224.1 hypothetical protein ISF_01125 [Cordyceps fumosorosea ARSEF 2679]